MAEQLIIRINAQAKGFFDRLDEMKEKTESLDRAMQATAKVSALAFAGLTAEIALATRAYAESEESARALNLTLQNQGIYSERLESKYKLLASAIQAKTGIDDDEVTKVENTIQAYLGQTEVTEGLLDAITDLSAGKKLDLETSSELIGKGIQGHTMALKKLGIEIDEHLSKEERTAQIIEQVTQKFGGQAAAANQGLGSIRGLTSAFGNLQEALGEKFAPVITGAIQSLTGLLQAAAENRALITLAAAVVAGGAAITGLVTAVSSAGIALSAMGAVAGALGVSLAATIGVIGGAALAVAALAAAVGLYLTRSKDLMDLKGKSAKDLSEQLDELRKREQALSNSKPGPFYDGFKEAEKTAALRKVRDEIAQVEAAQKNLDQLAGKKEVADKAAEDLAAQEARKQAVLEASNELLLAEAGRASQAEIDLKRQEVEILKQIEDDKNAAVREALMARLEENRALQAEAQVIEADQNRTFKESLLAQNEEFQALSEEQKALFLLKNQQALQAEILTEEQVRTQAAAARTKKQIADHNAYLENERRFGKAYAEIHKLLNDERVQGVASAASELVKLQTSNNSTLRAIGKAAAVTQITIDTARSAMSIFRGFADLGPWGIPLGIAGAAAAVAFGAEQIGRVTGAAEGGILTGGIPGRDSIPVMAMPGELVAPVQNFDEVIGSVRAQREAEKMGLSALQAGADGSGGLLQVALSLTDNLAEFVEVKILERQRIGVSLLRGGFA